MATAAANTAGQTKTYNPGQGTPAFAVGKDVIDATAITTTDYIEITVGFTPKYVKWENVTDRICGEWYEGMAADSCIKTAAAGTRTLEITSGNGGITVITGGFRVLQNSTLALVLASKTVAWRAQA
jgi:hypothetical protein